MTIINIIKLLTKREKLITISLFLMVIAMALLDMVGIASVMPFVYVLADPNKIQENKILQYFYQLGNFKNSEQYLIYLGIIFFLFIILSLIFKAITNLFQYRFILTREYTLGKRLFNNYLNQPYSIFLVNNTSDYANNILSEVNQVIVQAFIPLMNLIANICVSIAIFCLLIYVNFKLSIIILFSLGFSYLMIYFLVSKYLEKIGKEKLSANEKRFRIINESFGGIKEIKLNNLEDFFIKRFSKEAKIFATNQSISKVISLMPRFILEALTFGGMLLIVLYLFSQSSDLSQSLPIIALFALAGYKLIPSLQQIYASISSLKFAKGSLSNLSKELQKENLYSIPKKSIDNLIFKNHIILKNINYKYPDSNNKALNNVNLKINANTMTAFVGTTGGGKSSLIDIVAGLIFPDSGYVKVDNKVIDHKNILSWQKLIGYVPQNIFMADSSVARNIAFGQKEYDIERVKKVAKIALIDDFIEKNLSNKYETFIGEKGIKLSGGQKQRIGLARALYKSPKVLILDEATSALDNITEKNLMNSILDISSQMTIILIAHRLSSVVNCSNIYLVDQGSIIDSGTFRDLQKNEIFRDMSQNY